MTMPIAATFAQEWVQAWNRRDLESLLSQYSDDVEFHSSLVVKLGGDASGIVRGKTELRKYFHRALAAFPGELGLELLGVYQGTGSIVVLFELRGRKAAEYMEFNADGVVCLASAHSEAVS
jgi:ketosteroid isomerase-like protein